MKKKLSLILTLCLVLMLCTPVYTAKAAATYKLNAASRTLNGVGKKCTLLLTAPKKSKATWKSSNSKIAGVSKKGVVTAKKKGTVTITCTVKNGSKTKKLTCKVTVKVPAKAIAITNAKINTEYDAHVLELGSIYDFNAKRISSSSKSASTDIIRFYVKDPSKATVNSKTGVVTPLKTGLTTLTVGCGSTAAKALSPSNKIKQTINLYIMKPTIAVSKCELASGKVLTITFNKAMDSKTLLNGTSLTSAVSIIPEKGAADLGTLKGSMSEDNTILTVTSQNIFNGTYKISLSNKILSASGFPLTTYSESISLNDTTGPKYLGCSVDDTGLKVLMNFSEPINIDNLVVYNVKRNDNKALSYTAPFLAKNNYKLSADSKTILLNLTGTVSADQNTSIELTLYGIADLGGNPTNPYPLKASVFTNTTPAKQADLTNLYRNGNSLVAEFSRSIQVPGYAIVNNIILNGEVSKTNNKIVIYHINDTSLLNSTASFTVILNNFNAYNAGITNSTAQRVVNFSQKAALPSVTSSSLAAKTGGVNVLTLTYNEPVTLTSMSGYITGKNLIDGVTGTDIKYAYTAQVNEKTVTLTISESLTSLGKYTFTLPENFVIDSYYNYSAAQTVSTTMLENENAVLPAPTSFQIGGTSNEFVYITFDNMLDTTTAETASNYSISGISIQSAQIASNDYNCPAVIKLTVPSGSIVNGVTYQIKISGIKGYKGSYSVMSPYKETLTLSSFQTLESISVSATASTNTVTLTFPSQLKNAVPSNIDYTATVNNTNRAIKSAVISGSSIIFTFVDKITVGQTIVLKPSNTNYVVDNNNRKLLNIPLSVKVTA